jgi:CRP/FNR family transcriptional regulator
VPKPSGPKRRPEDTQLAVREAFGRSFRAGETIFDVGDPGECLYVLQAGEVDLARPAPGGARRIARLGPGDLFGEMSVLVGGPRRLRATAASPARVLELDASTLQAMCIERPEIGMRLMRRLARRVVELEQRLTALGVDDLLRPVVRVLLEASEQGPEGVQVDTTLRRLAEEAGLTMLEAHRALQQLFESRLVSLDDDLLHIVDPEALAGLA